jgi:hypothetical protein
MMVAAGSQRISELCDNRTDTVKPLCAKLADDRFPALVRNAHMGQRHDPYLEWVKTGLFDLESVTGLIRRDARVDWAAHITAIIPPWKARQIIRRGSL